MDDRYSRMRPPSDESEDSQDEEGADQIILSYEQLPEAQSWKDGETYQITVKQVSHDEESATFEVVDADTDMELPDEDEEDQQ